MFAYLKKAICRKSLCGLLLVSALLTIPAGTTLGKYVWSGYAGSFALTITPVYHPPQVTTTYLEHITVMSAGSYSTWSKGDSCTMYLIAEEGYILPETLSVTIDGVPFTIFTNGAGNPDGIIFDPMSGCLTISGWLLSGNPSYIDIMGTAVKWEPLLEQPAQEQPAFTEADGFTDTAVS